jgi:bifunctional non-homologous end joining protein LigD
VTWQEVEAGAEGEPLSFEAGEVLKRVDDHGDLFAEVLTIRQELPTGR